MGWSNSTLFLLKEKQPPKDFINALIEQLKTIGWRLASTAEFICFNDSVNGVEKETVYFEEEFSEQDIIDLLVSWKGLGMLEFFVPEFQFPVVISFLSWDDVSLEGFSINCNGKDKLFFYSPEKHRGLIDKIAGFVNFKLVAGNVDDYSYHSDLSSILQKAKENQFEILITGSTLINE